MKRLSLLEIFREADIFGYGDKPKGFGPKKDVVGYGNQNKPLDLKAALPKPQSNKSQNKHKQTLTWGNLPGLQSFIAYTDSIDPDLFPFNMELKGELATTAQRVWGKVPHTFPDQQFAYQKLKELIDAWDDGSDEAGDLASVLMDSFGYEWV